MSIRSRSIIGAIAVLMAVSWVALAQAAGPSNNPSVKWNCEGSKKECTCKNPQDCADMTKDAPCSGSVICDSNGKCHCKYEPQTKKN